MTEVVPNTGSTELLGMGISIPQQPGRWLLA